MRHMLDGGLADENFLEQSPISTMTLSAQWLLYDLHSNTKLHELVSHGTAVGKLNSIVANLVTRFVLSLHGE